MAGQYAGWTVWAGENSAESILGAEAAHYDIDESLSRYEAQATKAIEEAFPGIEVRHEDYPGTLGGNVVVWNADDQEDDDIAGTIDSIIADVFEGGDWAVELVASASREG